MRVLKPGGQGLIYVWAKNQFSQNKKSNYIKPDKKDEPVKPERFNFEKQINLPIHTNRTPFKHQDVFVPWTLLSNYEDKGIYLRYYHVFEENELKDCCLKLSNIEILSSYYDQGNWCVKLKKIE